MSRDSLTAQDAEHDSSAPGTSTSTETYGLRPDLHAQIMRMSPDDSPLLADMIVNYPGFMGAILMVAAPHMGNAAVQRAMQIVKQKHATQGQTGTMNQAETHEVTRDASDSR